MVFDCNLFFWKLFVKVENFTVNLNNIQAGAGTEPWLELNK